MNTTNHRPGPPRAEEDPLSESPTITGTYLSASDELVLSTERTGEGIERDFGQGLLVCRDRTDGGLLGLRLLDVHRHLGAAPHERLEMVPVSGASLIGLDADLEPGAEEGGGSVGALIALILRTTGLRVRKG
jgi:hypothetical protein